MICIATFFSHFGAMRCKKVCDKTGIPARMMPVPRMLSSSCGTCVRMEVENTEDVFGGVNLIAATSMISHGVDADRFNVMFFYGIPGNTAEYIQA